MTHNYYVDNPVPKFEVVSRLSKSGIDLLPTRKTAQSAGYDFVVAEDIIVPSYQKLYEDLTQEYNDFLNPIELDNLAAITKRTNAKPTLVSTGVKCHLDANTYLAITVRSSCPLKNWLILANSTGIIDADYCDNPDNEGEIFFQLINLSPFDIQLRAGDRIGQGIIMPYIKTCDDIAEGVRVGGFGSTDAQEIEGQKSLFEDYCECVFACNPERRAYVFGVDLSNG